MLHNEFPAIFIHQKQSISASDPAASPLQQNATNLMHNGYLSLFCPSTVTWVDVYPTLAKFQTLRDESYCIYLLSKSYIKVFFFQYNIHHPPLTLTEIIHIIHTINQVYLCSTESLFHCCWSFYILALMA